MATDFSKYFVKTIGSDTPIQGTPEKPETSSYFKNEYVTPFDSHKVESGMMSSLSSLIPGLKDIADKPLAANPNTGFKDIPGEVGKQLTNFATFPLRVAKDTLYDIPREATDLVKEQGLKAPGLLAEGALDTGVKMAKAFSSLGNYVAGAVSTAVNKGTGKSIDPNAEQYFKDTSVAEAIQKFVVENPEQVMLLLDGLNKTLNKSQGKTAAPDQIDAQLRAANEKTAGQLRNSEIMNIGDKTQTLTDLSKQTQTAPTGGLSLDVLTQQAGGMNPALKKAFDTALLHKDAATVQQLLPQIPAEYKMSFANEISKVVSPTTPAGVDVVSAIASPIKNIASEALSTAKRVVTDPVVRKLTQQTEARIESDILENFNKSIKPSGVGKGKIQKLKDYNDSIVTGVKAIKDNQPNLKFTDVDGNEITGRTPETIGELTSAIEQTKASIFKQYDAMAKAAGESGGAINVLPIADELNSVINNKSLQISNPEAVAYAKALQNRIRYEAETDAKGNPILDDNGQPNMVERMPLDTETAQQIIQNYNKTLEAFYKNPTYDTASRVAIDAFLVNKMRTALDKTITETQGEGYQSLKNQYGALSSIEKDVVKRNQVLARQNIKGLVDFTDILSGGELANGILTMNPGAAARGGAMLGVKTLYKYLNDPNRAVKKMFETLNTTDESTVPVQGGSEIVSPIIKPQISPSDNTTTQGGIKSSAGGLAPNPSDSSQNSNQDLNGYPPEARRSIEQGLKDGTVRFEPSKTGGEYIYSKDGFNDQNNGGSKTVNVTSYKDNPDGTTTNFLSDGSVDVGRLVPVNGSKTEFEFKTIKEYPNKEAYLKENPDDQGANAIDAVSGLKDIGSNIAKGAEFVGGKIKDALMPEKANAAPLEESGKSYYMNNSKTLDKAYPSEGEKYGSTYTPENQYTAQGGVYWDEAAGVPRAKIAIADRKNQKVFDTIPYPFTDADLLSLPPEAREMVKKFIEGGTKKAFDSSIDSMRNAISLSVRNPNTTPATYRMDMPISSGAVPDIYPLGIPMTPENYQGIYGGQGTRALKNKIFNR